MSAVAAAVPMPTLVQTTNQLPEITPVAQLRKNDVAPVISRASIPAGLIFTSQETHAEYVHI